MRKALGVIGLLLSSTTGTAAAETAAVAGLAPWERPAAAPLITEMAKAADWCARALTGVEPPYPASLRFLEDQGAWHTPFTHPGMTGPCDIRRWHGGD